MCGVCGQYNFERGEPVSRSSVRKMADAIAHRGPDDDGFHFSGGLGLGFRRLSIIDLAGGHQPMSDAEQTVVVAFNGEIYNFFELRAQLEALGHRFRTRSDTEVIVHGYKQWGNGVLGRLNGMFGLAIWDARKKKLLLARDRSGIKLIYYKIASGTVWFGSEIRAVLAALPALPPVDVSALKLFLRYRYTPSPHTLHEGVCKLAPGSMAIFEDGGWRIERWHQPQAATSPRRPPGKDAAEELLEIYRRAMKRHLLSDVPVGLLLSGGVDSGLLLGLMSEHRSGWPTYSAGYGQAVYKDDELGDAARSAALFGASNTAVQLSVAAFETSLPRIVSVLEEPVAASSIVPMYYLCERARHDVKVALVGQGPDELFGGYKRHLGIRYGGAWRALPAWVRKGTGHAIEQLHRSETLRRGVQSLGQEHRMARYQSTLSLMPDETIDGLFHNEHRSPGLDTAPASWQALAHEFAGMDELAGFQHLELGSTLPDELLMYADKLSMAHGLEIRVPYLDNEVVDFAQSLSPSQKIRLGRQKWLHRQVCEKYLPAEILRRKKRGFAVDAVDQWFRGGVASGLGDTLSDPHSLIYQYLKPTAVHTLLQEHRCGQRDNHKLLFSLVVLEQWLRGRESVQPATTHESASQRHGLAA